MKDYYMLKYRIKNKFGNQENFAKELGMSATNLNDKLNGKTNITIDEAIEFANLLKIKKEEMVDYFF